MHWTKFVALAAVAGVASGPFSNGQSSGTRPAFEVASIKPCKDGGFSPGGRQLRGGGVRSSPDTLHLGCTTLESLIQFAYIGYANGQPWRKVSGFPVPPVSSRLLRQPIKRVPAWVSSDFYTIDAKPDRPQSVEMMRGPMMQALLEDRFMLRVHFETRPVPVYLLTVARGGAKLQPARTSCTVLDFDPNNPPPEPDERSGPPCGVFAPGKNGEGVDTYGQTMAGLALQFSGTLDRDVIDRTGIIEKHDIHLDLPATVLFGNSDPGQSGDPFGDVSSALHELGLKLEPAKQPRKFLVVDRVERLAEN
jgi:uncharacterized protein (TIGR03435 family)